MAAARSRTSRGVLDRSLGRMHRVVDAVLLLLDLDLGRTADADDRNAARQLGETLPKRSVRSGKMIADAMKKVGNEGVIMVEEAKTAVTELDVPAAFPCRSRRSSPRSAL
jgi:hypothetical protein